MQDGPPPQTGPVGEVVEPVREQVQQRPGPDPRVTVAGAPPVGQPLRQRRRDDRAAGPARHQAGERG
ncbi:hypothetical protein, partial [Pseudonocardia sp. McavD-2-B]|uniref:hypothetical protein n=1 Tax=Pseudonocardia sp. McavD-2-B TaxID=2954499 RepID=UPI002097BFA9